MIEYKQCRFSDLGMRDSFFLYFKLEQNIAIGFCTGISTTTSRNYCHQN